MAKDQRLYGRFTLEFADSPKIMPLSDAAFRCLVEATLYSRRMLTDGFLSSRYACARWLPEVLEELCTNDPSKPSLIRVDEGFQIHDFAEHQTLKADLESQSEARKRAGRMGGLAKAKQNASKTQQPAKQKASKTCPETETETSKEITVRRPSKPIPDDWKPNENHRAKALGKGMDVDVLAEEMRNWALSKDERKANWDAAFTNWINRAEVKPSNAVRRVIAGGLWEGD